jgi:hypothetical protein
MKRSKKSKIGFLFVLFCFTAMAALAQDGFKYRAALPKVDSPGFYKISLQPTFVAKSEANLADLRLAGADGKFVAYVTAADVPIKSEQKFVVFPRVESSTQTDSGTTIIIENKSSEPLSRLWVKLKNTSVDRTMNISGGDDLKKWFAIEEGVALDQSGTSDKAEYFQELSFPASNYHYLKILVNDKKKTPVKFLEAGVYVSPSLKNVYQPISPVKITQTDSPKISYVTIQLTDKFQVNKIHLDIKGAKYYRRTISVYDAGKRIPELISEAEISSTASNDLYLSIKTNKIRFEIENGDNSPLIVTGATVYQTDQYIISYLEPGKQYYLLTGNAKTEAPNYDLKFFTDSLQSFIPAINHLEVSANPAYKQTVATKAKTEYTPFIWGAIIIALILLSLLTWKMIGEVNNKSQFKN